MALLVTMLQLMAAPSGAEPTTPSARTTTLTYYPAGPIYTYRWRVLELAMARTAEYGPVRLQPYPHDVSQFRSEHLLRNNLVQVIALGTSAEREARLLPVRIDILQGMVGYRLLVIRAADQARIAAMSDQDWRQQLVFGLNRQWADVPVMRFHGYRVETASGYEALFGMLVARRFDAFPRGINEARMELEQRRQQFPQLTIEQSRALYFPFPIYFWVNPQNPALAKRIELGLKRALADGSLRRLFQQHHAAEIADLRRAKRRVIHLQNTTLPPGTPQPDVSWWWPQ